MTAGELHEHVFQARLPGREVNQARPLLLHRGKQRGNRLVRLFDLQGEKSVFAAYRLHAGKTAPHIIAIVIHCVAERKFNYMVSAQARQSIPQACPRQ